MTNLPRALTDVGTNNEVSLLRSEPQSSRVYVTVHNPSTIYTARLAAVPASTDQITSITYNTGSGTHTDILADMTMWIGTSAGAYDLGMVRIRNLTGIGATSGTFEIAEESEIAWASGAYLTVKDEFSIWARHIRLSGTTPYMDYDVAYSNQNSACDSIPVMGQHKVAWLPTDQTVTVSFDASDSWTLNNSITTWAWLFPGADSYTDEDTATPTATYDAAGVYRVSLTVTNDDSAAFTAYRYVFILDDAENWSQITPDAAALQNLRIDSLSGDYDTGGWNAQVTLYANADTSTIRDRALCIIHTRDTYGTYNGSTGFVVGSENILFIGWIAGETITRASDNLYSSVSFTIEGPHYWLGRIPAFPVGLKDRTTTPTKWTRFLGLTARATVWHLLHWRTTITRCCDVYPLDNAYRAARIEAPGGQTLWEQLKYIELSTVLAEPCADRYGRLFNQVNQQLLDDTARGNVPECYTLDDQDITGDVEIERQIIDTASIVDLSGVAFDGGNPSAYFSLSPGRVFRRYGASPIVVEQLVLYDQATTNTLCGLYAGWRNNEYQRIAMALASNQRFIDIAPYQYWLYTLAAADSPRGLAESFRLIPRRVSYEWANTGGYLLMRAEFEPESFAQLAITGDAPAIIPTDPPPPPLPPDPPPTPIIDVEAKYLWLVQNKSTATPPLAVLYTDPNNLSDTWHSIEPPGALLVDELYSAVYFPTEDILMVVGHGWAPDEPSFTGQYCNCIYFVSDPLTSPSWVLKWHKNSFSFGATLLDFATSPYNSLAIGTSGITTWGFESGPEYMLDLNAAGTWTATGGENNGVEGPLIISPYAVLMPCGYRGGHTYLSADGIGPLPDAIQAGETTYYNSPETGTYDYGSGNITGAVAGFPSNAFAVRRIIATNILQIIKTPLFFSGFPNGDPVPWTVDKVLDETFSADPAAYWTNTYTAANYVALNAHNGTNGYLYIWFDGTWIKAEGTLPIGFAHFTSTVGSEKILFVSDRAVTSGNVPAKYTADIRDLTANPWVELTRDIWTVITGDLDIRHSSLSF